MKRIKDKRGNQRRCCLVPVDGKKGTTFANAQTVDISKGGIGLISNRLIPLDKKIGVQLETAPDAEPILVLGKVVWVSKIHDEARYRVGLKFQKVLSSPAQQRLSRATSVFNDE